MVFRRYFDKTGERSGEFDSKAAGWTEAASVCKHTRYKTYLEIDTRSTLVTFRGTVKDLLTGPVAWKSLVRTTREGLVQCATHGSTLLKRSSSYA
jgi:hypothetical protein